MTTKTTMKKLKVKLSVGGLICGGYQQFANEDGETDSVPASEQRQQQTKPIRYACTECGHKGVIKAANNAPVPTEPATTSAKCHIRRQQQQQQQQQQRLNNAADLHSRSLCQARNLAVVDNLHGGSTPAKVATTSHHLQLPTKAQVAKKLGLLAAEDLQPLRSVNSEPTLHALPFSEMSPSAQKKPESWLHRSPSPKDEEDEQEKLKMAPWFQPGLPRDVCIEILSPLSVGSFLVRCSESRPDALALSLKVPNQSIVHYLVISNQAGWKIKGSNKTFQSLSCLITHHSVMCELLPCPLRGSVLGASQNGFSSSSTPSSSVSTRCQESWEHDFADPCDLLDYPDLLYALRKTFGEESRREAQPSSSSSSSAPSPASGLIRPCSEDEEETKALSDSSSMASSV